MGVHAAEATHCRLVTPQHPPVTCRDTGKTAREEAT
jgi:hypothetical protein